MTAFLILALAALSRFFPHAMHVDGMNFTAVGAGLLFFGSRRPRWQAAIAMAVMAVTDICLTLYVYQYPFHLRGYLFTWAWYAAVCLVGSALLRKVSVLRVAAGVLASATSFFLITNTVVWMTSGMYAPNTGGLLASLVAGLPFYGRDLISTGLFSAAFFGLPVLAAKFSESMHSAQQPLA